MSEKPNKPTVLVADDERVIADSLAMILNQSGFKAIVAYTGEKALEMAAEFKPDMLISDVIMGGLNGIDAAIRIRELLPSIKILLFSGQAATADLLEKARAQGYEFEILAKPVHPQDLLAKLRS
jgi:CheY-like chemotaxis protein